MHFLDRTHAVSHALAPSSHAGVGQLLEISSSKNIQLTGQIAYLSSIGTPENGEEQAWIRLTNGRDEKFLWKDSHPFFEMNPSLCSFACQSFACIQ
mmetsp:Transcript_320/g.775  ORF Transcript_320/g.775 Transcript_320/m.775 type:complete len:96 (-) Transcript_320:202-489(-)